MKTRKEIIKSMTELKKALSVKTETCDREEEPYWTEMEEDVADAIEFLSQGTKRFWVYPSDVTGFGRCPECNALWDYSLISNLFFRYCPKCRAGKFEMQK